MAAMTSSRDTVEFSRKNTFRVYKTVFGRKNNFHVYKTTSGGKL